MASLLSNTGNALKDGASDVGDVGKALGQGVGEVGKGAADGVGPIGKGTSATTSQPEIVSKDSEPETTQQGGSEPTQAPQSVLGGIGEGIAGLGKQANNVVGMGFSNGFQIAEHLSKNTKLDLNRDVAQSIGGLGGTAVDAVLTFASSTTGAVFDPIANGLKAIEGLEGLGEGVDAINGLSTKALQGIAAATKEALSVAGSPPTFFDPEGDGTVKFEDTQKGFILIGLEENYARMAAYALHSTFSFSTSETWNPTASTLSVEMPIHVEKMSRTRWGKNWGNFERVDWVDDADIETFFGVRDRQTYAEYFKDFKSYFGTALLIFEWGTTWPLAFGPAIDTSSPATKQLGAIMRTVIIPTIAQSHKNAKKADPDLKQEERPPFPPNTDKEQNA